MGSETGRKIDGQERIIKEGDPECAEYMHLFSLEKLNEVQEHLQKVNEEESDKVLEVEQKYNEKRRPVYLKRNDIIKSIPHFWLTAFLSHPVLGDMLSKEDQKIFEYLESLEVKDFKDIKSGYYITFNFKENPYFQDTKLTKTFSFLDEHTTRITGTNVKWKEATGNSSGAAIDKGGKKRAFSEESFFSWFNEIQSDDTSDELLDEVADVIKEDLWVNPLRYFANEVDDKDSDGDDDDEDLEDDEDKDAIQADT